MNDILNNTTDYNLVSAAPGSVDETFRYLPTQAPAWREMPKVDNAKWDRLVNGALAGVDKDARAELGDDVLASDYAVQDKDGGNYLLGAEYADMVGGNAYEAAEQLIAKLPEEEREAAMERLNSCNSEGDGVRLLGELFRGQVRKEWGKQELLAEERVKEMSGLLRDIVLTGDGKNKNGEGWVKFFDGKSRGVWSDKDEQSVARAAEAFSMFEGMVKEYEDASANVLTKASTGRLMLDYLRGDELAEALFFSAVQEKVSDMKADAEERNAFVRFAKLFQAKRQELGASLMGGHFVPFVSDEQVERFNAELPTMRKRAEEAAMHAGPLAAERAAVTGFAISDAEFEAMRSAALASGQLNEDGSLRKMTDEERARSQELDAFRGKLHNAVQGAYDLSGVAATLGKMMPSSLVYLAPYGFVPGFVSARTLNLAQQLGEGETWTRANVTATTDAMIQAAVEKLAFGSLNPGKMAFGMDWLMSRPVVNRMLGRVYGTTAGRVGMNVAGGVVEESIGEPLAGLLLSGVYNAAAAAEFRLEDPMGDFYEEIGEMLQPDQLLATALYGLLLGGINWHGHATAARDYREVFAKLVEMGNTPEAAGAMARNDDFVATFKATKELFEETLKEDAGRVLDYLAELYPQLQGMSAIENYYQKRLLPKLLPAENGMVRVQELDEDGNVSEVLMEEGAARLLVAARLESLEASELHKLADWVVGNAMVGTISKDNKRWIISEEAETMDADYFMRLARAAGVRLKKGAKAEDIDPEVHPHIPLGQLAQQGKAWETRMSIVRNKLDRERKKKGLEPMTEAEWAERKKKFYSKVNRVGVRQQDGSVRTVLRVARGGFGALEALEDITEDNLVRDMSVTGRDLDWYIQNLTELELALGRQGEFLKPLAKGEKREALDVVEAISEIVKAKVLDDTARPNNGLSAALNAFLDMLRGWFANAMAIMRLGAEVNKVLKDEKAREKMSPEFVQLVDDLARQDVELLQELQLKEGLDAMQRVRENTSAVLSGMKAGNDTPIVDEARKKHGKKVREARKKRMKQQRKVDADVAVAEAALEGDSGSMSVTDAQERGLFEDGVLEASNAIVTEPSFSIEAMHVTPHRFRKFSTEFMGTGEGQQAFGWGLYFMTNDEVNQSYYEGFAEYGDVTNLRVELNVRDENLLMWDAGASGVGDVLLSSEACAYVVFEGEELTIEEKLGRLADAIDNRTLLEDFYSEAKELGVERRTIEYDLYEEHPVEETEALSALIDRWCSVAVNKTMQGWELYNALVKLHGSPRKASLWLLENGVKGIKYFDGMSRNDGKGTYNYVIFSGDDIKITGVNETGDYNAPWEDYVDETASFSVREKEAPKKTGIGYKVFYQKDGKLYPPMVANPGGADTPVGVWLDADEAPRGEDSKTGRPRVQAGGKGTNAGKQLLAYRPGWHLGKIPYALQFNRKNPLTGERDLFPKDFVWAEVEYAADEDYQAEVDASDKRHSYRGLQRVPEDGFYEYRTNPDPKTDPWIITGAMKVNRVLSKEEVDELVRAAGREPQKVQGDEIEVLESLSVADREIEEYRDNTIEFNVVSATDEDTRAYQRLHMRANGLTEEKIEGYFALMDNMVSDVLEISKDIPEFKEWQERAVYYYFEQGGKLPRLAPSVSALKKNGDYPINFDLGTLCVKREMMTLLTDKLIAMGYADRLGVSQLQQLKEILREAGISVACDICFVEARRVRALQQAQQLAYYWNAVRATAGIETNAPIGFAEELTEEQIAKLERMADTENADKVLKEMVAEQYRRRDDYDLGLSTKAMTLIAKIFLQDNSMAGEASLNDFMSASKVDFMLRQYPHTNIRSLLASAFGAGTGKPLEDFNVYDGLSWRELKMDNDLDDFRDDTYNIGGARVQSFSDFNPILFLDYYQMMFDLAWRQMPLQSYTKVTSFVELFGHCGIKINMSLIPDVVDGVDPDHAGLEKDEDGNWVYAWHKDSFPIKLAYQYREMDEYHKNVGIVAVGISREHVRMLLRDGKIDYVIPFHRSGMPTTIMISTGLDKATDFSDVQLTRKLTEEEDKKTKKKKLKLTKADDKFSFNQEMRRLGDPKLAAKAYLEYCDRNGFVPKFDEFRDEENYYKLLVDFRVYDKHGEYAPQGPVTTDMPEDWAARLEKALGSRVKEQRKMESLLEDSGVLAKAEAVMKQTPLEGALRKVMLERLNDALRNGPKGGKNKVADPVHLMKASEFQAKLRELSMANMDQADEAKFSEMFRTQKGHIYGFSHRGEIYLAENMFNAHTPAHEFVHVWAKVAQQFAPELWAKGVNLLKRTAEWDNVLTDPFYWNIHGNDDAVASEVMARMVGYRVEEMVREVTDPKKKALTEKGLGEKIREWAKALWTKVRSLFDAPDGKPLTLKEFIQMPLADLWDKSRNKKFNSHVRKMLKKTPEQREQVAMTNMASMSISDMEEEDVGKAIAAAGNGFKANQAFAEQMLKEIRSSLARMKRLGSKSRTEREEAIAAMGGINHMVKALVQYLPKGYRFSVHPYTNKLDVLTELATTGNVEMMRENVSKGLQEWMDETSETWHEVLPTLSGNENLSREELTGLVQDIIKEHAGMKLTDAVEAIVNRVAEQLRRHAKDKAVQKMHELLDATLPKKDKKTGKMKGGKMAADDYRDLEIVKEALGLNSEKLKSVMAALKEEMKSPGLSEEARDAIESKLTIYDQFGDPKSMGAEEAVAAYEALRQRIWMNRFAWDNIMSERRAARRAMVRRVVDGVGSVSQNEYNAKKRRVKPIKRVKNLADILSGMPAAVEALSGYLPLRELAKSLTTRANIAGELIKQWEAERWLALEELSLETLGRSWRECMSFMHEVLPTGVSFDMPTYRNVDIKVSALRSLLEMGKKERMAEMERRRKAGGKMAETALWESDIEAAARELQRMDENGEVKTWVHVRYQSGVQHEENLRLSRGEALYAVLMYEQPRYTEKLQAQGYTPEVIAGLKKFIGEEMLQFGYGLRELFRIQGDKIAVVYERAFGVPFYREENYFAARWDVSEMKENSAEQLLAGMAGTTGAGNGWMKQRVDHNLDLDMTKDALEVFLQATSLTDTWMATQDIVADFKAWTREKEFGRAMTALIGEDSYQNLKDWIRILEQGGVQDCLNMGVAQDVINGIYGSGAVAILGLRVQTLIRQVPSVFNGLLGAHDISSAEWLMALASMKKGDAPMTFTRMVNSVLMKNRQQGKAGLMASQAMRSGDSASSSAEEFLLASMLPMEWMDARCTALSLVPVWNVYYQRAVKKGASHKEAEKIAWDDTTVVANLSSQPIGWLNKSKIGQNRNPIVKSLFYMLSENTAKFALCNALARSGKKKAAARAWLIYGAANAAISALLDWLQGDPDEWEKGNWWEYLLSALYGPLASLPGVGELVEALGTMLVNAAGHAWDIEAAKKAKMHASVGRALIDLQGSYKAVRKIIEFATDDEEHSLAEYTRAASTVSRTVAIGTGWMGTAIGYWSTAVAVLMNPIDFGARVWRNMKQYYAEE